MTRDQQSSAPVSRKPGFVPADIRMSRDGRWLLHFLAGGAVVCQPVEFYRALLGRAEPVRGGSTALAARFLVGLRLVLFVLALGKALAGTDVAPGLVDAARCLADQLGGVLELPVSGD